MNRMTCNKKGEKQTRNLSVFALIGEGSVVEEGPILSAERGRWKYFHQPKQLYIIAISGSNLAAGEYTF